MSPLRSNFTLNLGEGVAVVVVVVAVVVGVEEMFGQNISTFTGVCGEVSVCHHPPLLQSRFPRSFIAIFNTN